MTDNIRPNHYRTGEIDLFESWYRTYPFNEYRAIMQAIAERYMRRDKNDRVEDLNKSIYTLERLKEKEIEHWEKQGAVKSNKTLKYAFSDLGKTSDSINFDEWFRNKEDSENIHLLKDLYERGFNYLARHKNEGLWAYDAQPIKLPRGWIGVGDIWGKKIGTHYFPEVKWSDDDPTKISKLLASYENGGGNGK